MKDKEVSGIIKRILNVLRKWVCRVSHKLIINPDGYF